MSALWYIWEAWQLLHSLTCILQSVDVCITNNREKIMIFACGMLSRGVRVFRGSPCFQGGSCFQGKLLCGFVDFCSCASCVELLPLLLLRWLCWAFTSSWGASVRFELCIYTRSVLSPFLPSLEGSCVLVSVGSTRCPCVWELRLLILRDPIPAFSFGFWVFLNELLFDFFSC